MQYNNNSIDTIKSLKFEIPSEHKIHRDDSLLNNIDNELLYVPIINSETSISYENHYNSECKEKTTISDENKKTDIPIIETNSCVISKNIINNLIPVPNDFNLFEALDKANAILHKERNDNLNGYSDIPLAATSRVSLYNAADTDILLCEFFKKEDIFYDIITPGMNYKCSHSSGFGDVSFQVKLYFFKDKKPIIEFWRYSKDVVKFFKIYYTFLN